MRNASRNARGPLVVVNCATLNTETAAPQIFGYVKGAFARATRDHAGFFEQAEGGVLFLDEVGTLKHDTQAGVLQDKVVTRIGAQKGRKVDVHIVCATNEDLPSAVEKGTFGEDLYMRLKGGLIPLPPLLERVEEIAFVINKHCGDLGIAPDFVQQCLQHDGPGNVRDVIAVVQAGSDRVRAVKGRSLTAEDIKAVVTEPPEEPTTPSPVENRAQRPRDPEKFETFERELGETGNVAAAAKIEGRRTK